MTITATENQRLSIVHAIARLNVGGAALHVMELAARQRARGHEVVVAAGQLAEGEESMEYLAHDLGLPIVRVSALQRELSPLADARAVFALRRLVVQRRADVLHTHTPGGRYRTNRRHVRASRSAPSDGAHVPRARPLRVLRPAPRTDVHPHGAPPRSKDRSDRGGQRRGTGRPDRAGCRATDRIAVIPYGFDLSGLSRPDDAERAPTQELHQRSVSSLRRRLGRKTDGDQAPRGSRPHPGRARNLGNRGLPGRRRRRPTKGKRRAPGSGARGRGSLPLSRLPP